MVQVKDSSLWSYCCLDWNIWEFETNLQAYKANLISEMDISQYINFNQFKISSHACIPPRVQRSFAGKLLWVCSTPAVQSAWQIRARNAVWAHWLEERGSLIEAIGIRRIFEVALKWKQKRQNRKTESRPTERLASSASFGDLFLVLPRWLVSQGPFNLIRARREEVMVGLGKG